MPKVSYEGRGCWGVWLEVELLGCVVRSGAADESGNSSLSDLLFGPRSLQRYGVGNAKLESDLRYHTKLIRPKLTGAHCT